VLLAHYFGHQARSLALQPQDLIGRQRRAGNLDIDEWHGLLLCSMTLTVRPWPSTIHLKNE
jgi:hypothetical protein